MVFLNHVMPTRSANPQTWLDINVGMASAGSWPPLERMPPLLLPQANHGSETNTLFMTCRQYVLD